MEFAPPIRDSSLSTSDGYLQIDMDTTTSSAGATFPSAAAPPSIQMNRTPIGTDSSKLASGGSDSASTTSTLLLAGPMSRGLAYSGTVISDEQSGSNDIHSDGDLFGSPSFLPTLVGCDASRKDSTSTASVNTKVIQNEEQVDFGKPRHSDSLTPKQLLALGEKHKRRRSLVTHRVGYQSYQCCGCRCRKLKPHQIGLVVVLSLLLSVALFVTAFYVVVPIQIRAVMDLPEMVPQYSISDLRNDSFQVHIAQNIYMYSPIYVTIEPYVLTVVADGRQVGWLEANGYEISPGANITANHTTRFQITDDLWLRQLGHRILSSLANQSPNTVALDVSTTLIVHTLGFTWHVPYERKADIKTGYPASSSEPAALEPEPAATQNSTTTPPPVSVQNWSMSALNGVTLNLTFNNPIPLAVDLDEVRVNILMRSRNLGQAIIPDLSVGMGRNFLPISLYVKNLFNAIGFGINFMGNAEETLIFQNITVTSAKPNVQLPWINGWFNDVVVSVPFSRAMLNQRRRRRR